MTRLSRSMVEEHLDYQRAAERLSCSVSTIRRLVARGPQDRDGRPGIFPVRKVSRQLILIPASAINHYLDRVTQ